MNLYRILGTTSFRLSALYMSLFLLSFLAVGMTVYFLTTHILERQMRNSIEIEAKGLKKEYDEGGLTALKSEIADKEKITSGQTHKYGILDSGGLMITGNIGSLASSEGWQKVPIITNMGEKKHDETEYLKVKVTKLSDRYWLGVGYNTDYIEDAGEAVIKAFLWGALLVLILGGAGGVYLSRSFLKKIESLTKSTQAIIAGEIRHRLSISENRDELDNLAILLNRMLDRICTLIENVQQVSNDIAHDMRTPITHLKFRLERALQEDMTSDQYKNHISGMIAQVDNILDTFTALLRIAQIESGSRRSGFSSVNLSNVIKTVTEALEPVAEEKHKHFVCDIESDITITGDKELLTQLAFNLVENAIVHTPSNAEICVGLHKGNASIQFYVSDNGLGIPKDERDRVFQRFYRLEESRTTEGSGLGLSIVSAIAELHGAVITLSDNQPGLKILIEFNKTGKDRHNVKNMKSAIIPRF
jgi:signal transduction histidine kinase